MSLTPSQIADYHSSGFTVLRNVFTRDEIAEIGADFDAVQAEAKALGKTYRHKNMFYRIYDDPALGPICRLMQWPSWNYPLLDAVRRDSRFVDALRPLIGDTLKQVINQLHWKHGSTVSEDFAFHQDSQFRKPVCAYRDLGSSCVQTGLAIDPHVPDAGGLWFVRGSHRLGEIEIPINGAVMDNAFEPESVSEFGFDPRDLVALELDPGDLVLWHIHLVHGSGPNCASHLRRFYINGYVSAEKRIAAS